MKPTNTPDLSNLSPVQKRQLLAKLLQQQTQQTPSGPSDSPPANEPTKVAPAQQSDERPSKLSTKQPAITHDPGRRTAPLSFAQQRLWFVDQLQPGQTVYSIPAALKFEGTLQIEILRQCLNEIVARHDILRTQFVAIDGEPIQQIQPQLTLALSIVEVSVTASTDKEPLASALLPHFQAVMAQPFDLENGPLLRAQLLKLSETEHVLILVIHHIVADYWSLRVVMKETALLYQAFAQASSVPQSNHPLPSPLAALPIQYGDYAAWQQHHVAAQTAGQLEYWQQQLAKPPAVLQLPTDCPRPALQTFSGAKHSFSLPAALCEKLTQLAQRSHATLFMTLLAAFQVLLARYSGQQDILVGSTVSNRDRTETQNLIGLFVNNLVFRANVVPEQSFETFLQQVKTTALNAYSHQDIPFEQVVDALDIDRQLSHNALFQAMFILHNTPKVSFELPSLNVTPIELDSKTARFDISLDMYEGKAVLTGVFEYNTELFSSDTIERLANNFETLLNGIVDEPSAPIGSLPLLARSEIAALQSWNQTHVDIPQQGAHQLIEAQAEKTPDAIALSLDPILANSVFSQFSLPEQLWTYQQLNQQANQLAHYLTDQGIQPGDRIALALNRSPELVIALLAVLKLGGTYIPLDPTHPASRLKYVLQDAQVTLILEAEGSFTGHSQDSELLVSEHKISEYKILDIKAKIAEVQQRPTHNLITTPGPEDLAYIIYTSGSTGKPKGVLIRHRSLVNLLSAMTKAPGITAKDSLLAVTTVAFDIATLELLLPLTVGARLAIANADTVRDRNRLIAQLKSDNITIMQATPATWRLLLDGGWQGARDLKILCGGEALDLPLAQQLLPCGRELWNLYGPTETTIWSSAIQLSEDLLSQGFVPIGGPIDNTEFYIVDEHHRPVPTGVSGELLIGGLGLTPGYLNRPELTTERFIPNPSQTSYFPTFYKTGDRVRRHPNGTLEYLGRFDHQVKLRGFRIELGDIEAALAEHPDIDQAVVALYQEDTNEP
ncbi:MAG: amino acid adenylation domain-containing protein, partial [Cyanobacteria bacterium J06631_9]